MAIDYSRRSTPSSEDQPAAERINYVRRDRKPTASPSSSSVPTSAAPTASTASPPPTTPSIASASISLPSTPPEIVSTGFVDTMKAYEGRLQSRFEMLMDLEGPTIDRRWRELVDALVSVHHWNPTTYLIESLRLGMMRNKVVEWARRDGAVTFDDIGWTPVLDAVERLELSPFPCDRDWTSGPIELQHRDAVPVAWNYLDSLKRIGDTCGWKLEGQDLFIRLANLYEFHINDFAQSNNNEMEIVSGDVINAITSRDGWEPEWAFFWPTYFGQVGVYGYNLWIEKLPLYEYIIAKGVLEEED